MVNIGQLELICEVFSLYNLYTEWVHRYGLKKPGKEFDELFHSGMSLILSNIGSKLDLKDERFGAIYDLLSKHEKLKGYLPPKPELPPPDPAEAAPKNMTELFYARFASVKKSILSDLPIKKELKSEFNNFCEILLDLITSSEYSGIPNCTFIGKLIEYIGFTGTSSEVNIHLVKYLLTAFTKIIKMAGKMDKRDEDNKGKQKKQKKVLKILDSLKLTKTILSLLCSEESERLNSIMPLLLRLANKMLTEAFPAIQNQFYAEFQSNPKSERLFERMHGMINRNIFIYYRHPKKFATDFGKADGKMFSSIDVQAEILKLLKSLCENHNANLQQYMVKQRYSRNSYSMVTIIIEYLQVLVYEIKHNFDDKPRQNMTHDIQYKRISMSYKHAVLAILALTEFVQGPCKINQNEISETNFFSIADVVINLKFLFDDTIQEHQRDLLRKDQVSQLKKVCAILLSSMMEQRENGDPVVIKMRQCISETGIIYNLQYVYFAFTKESDSNYTEELLFPVFSSFWLTTIMLEK